MRDESESVRSAAAAGFTEEAAGVRPAAAAIPEAGSDRAACVTRWCLSRGCSPSPVTLAHEVTLAHPPDTSEHEQCAEIREALAVATREFDPRTRRLLEHVISGVSYGKIAAREHASVGAIKPRVHRVRLKLREV